MAEKQKDIIAHLLKEQGKSKRALSQFLNIHENGINRILGSPTIGMDRLTQIAEFLELNVVDLLEKIYNQSDVSVTEKPAPETHIVSDYSLSTKEQIILLLSEIIQQQKKIAELENQNGDKLANMLNLFVQSQSFSK